MLRLATIFRSFWQGRRAAANGVRHKPGSAGSPARSSVKRAMPRKSNPFAIGRCQTPFVRGRFGRISGDVWPTTFGSNRTTPHRGDSRPAAVVSVAASEQGVSGGTARFRRQTTLSQTNGSRCSPRRPRLSPNPSNNQFVRKLIDSPGFRTNLWVAVKRPIAGPSVGHRAPRGRNENGATEPRTDRALWRDACDNADTAILNMRPSEPITARVSSRITTTVGWFGDSAAVVSRCFLPPNRWRTNDRPQRCHHDT